MASISSLRHLVAMPNLRRLLGLVLLLGTYAPFHRLLDPRSTGLAGATTRRLADGVWSLGVWGSVLALGVGAALAVSVRSGPRRLFRPLTDGLKGVPLGWVAAAAAGVACALSASAALLLFGGLPTTVDEMVQLLHARALLAGEVALSLPAHPAAWMVQNSLMTPMGWASVYPPLHTVALAAGAALGSAWLVGPVATGATAGLTTLALGRLLPGRPVVVRIAAVATAVSPLVVLLGGTHLSHTVAAALAAATLWCATRAREGGWGWALATGAVVGGFVCARPWTGLVLSAALLVAVWGPEAARRGGRWAAVRAGALAVGGIPFALFLLGWNRALFGGPFTLGYAAAFGPAHGLGFHPDPWGNAYGPLEALAYTGADLVLLGSSLLETPWPALAVVGAGLLVAPGAWRGTAPLFAWALAGVAANAVYWHHGIHLGPRLLFETAPAWVALFVVAAAALTAPGAAGVSPARRTLAWGLAAAWAGALFLAPARALSNAGGGTAEARFPDPPATPALVFAHGSWSSRVAARLAAEGMRRDSVETALRRNDLCALDHFAKRRASGLPPGPQTLDFEPLPGPAPGLVQRFLSPGNAILVRPGATPSPDCLREARADAVGSVELEPLLWQAPPTPGSKVVVARDLGPEENRRVMDAYPGVTAFLLVASADGAPPRYLPYAEGMVRLWGAQR